MTRREGTACVVQRHHVLTGPQATLRLPDGRRRRHAALSTGAFFDLLHELQRGDRRVVPLCNDEERARERRGLRPTVSPHTPQDRHSRSEAVLYPPTRQPQPAATLTRHPAFSASDATPGGGRPLAWAHGGLASWIRGQPLDRYKVGPEKLGITLGHRRLIGDWLVVEVAGVSRESASLAEKT